MGLTPSGLHRLDETMRQGAAAPGFVLPAVTTAKYDGDSRTDNTGGYTVSGGTLTVTAGTGANSSVGLVQAVLGNKWLMHQGYQHAIGASSTEAMMYRARSTSIAATGNPANGATGLATDACFSRDSDGAATVLTQSGGLVVSASMSVNDIATFYDVALGAGHANATAVHSLENIGAYADDLRDAGKALLIGNEFPRGRVAYQMESRTVSGGTCTASRTSGFIDGESYGAPGVIGQFATGLPRRLARVAGPPGQDQYTVGAGGIYTFGGTAPTMVWLTYSAQGSVATSVRQKIVNAWCNASADRFVDPVNGVSYGLPGLKARPNVIVADTFGALVDPASGSTQLSLPGTMDTLELHHNQLGALKAAKAFQTAFDAAYPSAPSQEMRPTRNNWYAARGTGGASQIYSGVLPPTMRIGFTGEAAPTLVSINGVPVGKVDTRTGVIAGTGIASGSLDFATGAWTIAFATPATSMPVNAQLWFEQDMGNYDLSTMTEGTIGRNAEMNGLMDMTAASGTGLSVVTGATSIAGIGAGQIPYGWSLVGPNLSAAVGAGTATVAASAGTGADGFPTFTVDWEGTASSVPQFQLVNNANNPGARLMAGDRYMGGARISYADHPTNGGLYGTNGCENKAQIQSAAVSRNSPAGSQNVTVFAARTVSGSTTAGANLYYDSSLVAEWGGPLDLYHVTPLIDTTGCTFVTLNHMLTVTGTAGVPFAGRYVFGQCQMRRRNDVA